ncbi:MAG: hypothetical protein ACO1N9_09925 [Flavobacterium sp.]
MKNLFLSAAMLLAIAATAQTETTTVTTTSATTQVGTDKQSDYKTIKQSEIAPEVLKQAVSKYKDYALVEALVATDNSNYKLVLTKDGKDVAVYYKPSGEFIKEETA